MCVSQKKRKDERGQRNKKKKRKEGRREGEKKSLTNTDSKLPTCEIYTQREIINMLEKRGTYKEREVLLAMFQLTTPIPV